MANQIKEFFKNNKNGSVYRVLYLATDRTNAREGNKVVVYTPVDDPSEIAVRDADEFHQKFTLIDQGHDLSLG